MTAARTIGTTTVDLTCNAAAIQAAINSLPAAGGTVKVPAGVYEVDAVNAPILLRSHVRLDLTGVILQVRPNSAIRYYAIKCQNVTDVEIIGGVIHGDRDVHSYVTAGLTVSQQTHEWGMGIGINGGARITVTGATVMWCTGDGICVGGAADDVLIQNTVSDANRRQGISITSCSNVVLMDSQFIRTNGTSPECGMDVEPDSPYSASNVYALRCKFSGNNKFGVNVFARASNVTLEDCTVEDNVSCGVVTTTGSSNTVIKGGTIQRNGATGVKAQTGTAGIAISAVTFFDNYRSINDKDRVDFDAAGVGTANYRSRDILIATGVTGVNVGVNHYK